MLPEQPSADFCVVVFMKKYFSDCLVCKKSVLNFPSRKRKFCSHKCSSVLRNELKSIVCKNCGKELKQTSSRQERCGNTDKKGSCSYKHNRSLAKDRTLMKRYGVTRGEHNEMLKRQNFRCAICVRKVKLVVDHCHKTGEIRGLLCSKCNSALGMLRDNTFLLEKALNYLAPFAL